MIKGLSLIHKSECLEKLHVSVPGSDDVRFQDEWQEQEWFQKDMARLRSLWGLLVELASARSWSQSPHAVTQPNAFVAALHDNEDLATRHLELQRRTFSAVFKAESMANNPRLPKLLVACLQCAREAFLTGELGSWIWRTCSHLAQVARQSNSPTAMNKSLGLKHVTQSHRAFYAATVPTFP